MLGQLGDIVFDGPSAPDSLSLTGEETYVEHPLINSRPKLDRTGTGLRTISMGMQFHFSFCTPEANLAALWAHKANADILPFVLGNGRVIGNFVITSITETPSDMAPNGTYICAKAQVSLKEFYVADNTVQIQQRARAAAIALGENNPIPVLVRDESAIEAAWAVVEGITQAQSIAAAISNVVKYASQPEFWLMAAGEIGVYTTGMLTANQDVLDALDADSTLTDLCPFLQAAVSTSVTAIGNLISSLPITDYDVLSTLTDAVIVASQAVNDSALAIFYNVILRR